MAFSNYEWIAEGFAKIEELEKRIEKLEDELNKIREESREDEGE